METDNNFINVVSNYNALVMSKYYISLFGSIPSVYSYGIHRNKEISLGKINDDIVKKFVDSDFYMLSFIIERVVDKTSAVDGQLCEMEYNGNPFGDYISPHVAVVCESKKMIIKIGTGWVQVLYDKNDDIDIKSYVKNIIKHCPKKSMNTSRKTAAVKLVLSDSGCLSTLESNINSTKIDIKSNYNDDFENVDKTIFNFISSKDRKSGIILLSGDPGTGKTYYIRNLITRCKNKDFILIPSSLTSVMSSPEFLALLMDNKNAVFIIEDCEDAIKDRSDVSFNSAIASILNMSDGLMSDIFNGRFICTFNCDKSEIDSAILRKGRCVADYEFKPLSIDKTNNLFKKLGIDYTSETEMTLADIFNYNGNGTDCNKQTKKIGF